jgi:hypothetical protein
MRNQQVSGSGFVSVECVVPLLTVGVWSRLSLNQHFNLLPPVAAVVCDFFPLLCVDVKSFYVPLADIFKA